MDNIQKENSIDIINKHVKLLNTENQNLKTEIFELNERVVGLQLDIKVNDKIYSENIKHLNETIKHLKNIITFLEKQINKN